MLRVLVCVIVVCACGHAPATQTHGDRPRVLVVDGGHDSDAFVRALGGAGFDVRVGALPDNQLAFGDLDLLVLDGVPQLDAGAMAYLDAYLTSGGGVLVTGIAALRSYAGSSFEAMLPVRFRNKAAPPEVAIVFVVDRGASAAAKLAATTDAVRRAIARLAPSDLVAVVAFDTEAQMIVRPTPASERVRIDRDLARLAAGTGENVFPGLKQAHEILAGIEANTKHVVLVTDGGDPFDGVAELVDEMAGMRETVSFVALDGVAQPQQLGTIGRLHRIADVKDLGAALAGEVEGARGTPPREIYARIAKRAPMLEDTGVERAPRLPAYAHGRASEADEVVLIADDGDPLLVVGHDGIGKVVVWTSDLAAWATWPGYAKLWTQIARATARRR